MSEIKLNPKNITIDEVFRFVDTLDLNKSDGVALKTMIWEVSQKPLQEIVERLEEECKAYRNTDWTRREKAIKVGTMITAMEIVKEVGGMNDNS